MRFVLLAALVLVTIVAVALAASTGFNNNARVELGAGLLGGVVVGLALLAFEKNLESARRNERLAEQRRRISELELEADRPVVALLAARLIALGDQMVGSDEHDRCNETPNGWRGREDAHDLGLAAYWLAHRLEVPVNDGVLTVVEVLAHVADEVAHRCSFDVDPGPPEGFYALQEAGRQEAVYVVARAASWMVEIGGSKQAMRLDRIAYRLGAADPARKGWLMPTFRIGEIGVMPLPSARHTSPRLALEVAALAEMLRQEPHNEPISKGKRSPQPRRRWADLLDPDDTLDGRAGYFRSQLSDDEEARRHAQNEDRIKPLGDYWDARWEPQSWFRRRVLDTTELQRTLESAR